MAVQLGLDIYVRNNELELNLAISCKHLIHHLVELLGLHGFKDAVLHRARRFP